MCLLLLLFKVSGLQVGIFSYAEAWTCFPGVEVVMTQNDRRWVLLAQLGKQLSQCRLLLWGPGVAGGAFGVQSSLVADSDAVRVMPCAVGTYRFFGSSFLHGAVTAYDVVITYHAPSTLPVPKVDVLGRALLPGPDSRAMDD